MNFIDSVTKKSYKVIALLLSMSRLPSFNFGLKTNGSLSYKPFIDICPLREKPLISISQGHGKNNSKDNLYEAVSFTAISMEDFK